MEPARKESRQIEPKLGLWDAVSNIVGIIIGVGIFSTPASIFAKVPDVWTAMGVWVLGGLAALRQKSLALTDLFIALVEERCDGHGLGLVTPKEHARRGSQVCLTRQHGAYAIVQALIARGVIGDFRAGTSAGSARTQDQDILRFGFTPLYTSFADVWHSVDHLRQVLAGGEWERPQFNQKHAVT